MNDLIFVYITTGNKEEARKIAKHLLDKKLIACANIFPIESIYKWEGKVKNESEFVLIGKTLANKFEKIKKEIEKIHSYNIPCIIKIPVSSNKKYYDWVKKSLKNN